LTAIKLLQFMNLRAVQSK